MAQQLLPNTTEITVPFFVARAGGSVANLNSIRVWSYLEWYASQCSGGMRLLRELVVLMMEEGTVEPFSRSNLKAVT